MKSVLAALRAERIKLTHTLALWMVLLTPLAIAILLVLEMITVGDRRATAGIPTPDPATAWLMIGKSIFGLWCLLMLPLFITLEAALLAALEHANQQWKHLLALPIPPAAHYLAKLLVLIAMVVAAQLILLALTPLAGWVLMLVDPGSGIVWDGTHPYEDQNVDRTVWTYNQGTVVGAEVQLWQLTGDRAHLDRARRTVTATLSRYGEGGFPTEGAGDGSVFKGILARYLGDLVKADPEGSQRVRVTLASSGTTVAAAAGAPVGIDWQHPTASEAGLGSEVSAALLLESLAGLERPM